MRALSPVGRVALLLAFPAIPLGAQGWVPPQPPCDPSASHFRVNSGVVYLRTAAEKPTQRDRELAQAKDVLTRAIRDDKQDQSPAAWYYLGRYYVEVNDAVGADSAFSRAAALAPACKADIDGYRQRLWATVLNGGVAAWQNGKEDSAVSLFHLAARLLPANPKPFVALAGLYAGKDKPDSAAAYYRQAAQAAAGDTAFARERREALSNVARIYLGRAQSDPAVQQWSRLRASRDSLERAVANDSIVLARMVVSSASRRARKARLSPADQQTFSRDSTARAEAVERGRAGRTALAQQAATVAAALQAAYAPAIQAYRDFLAAYPDVVEAATNLAMLLGQSGRESEAVAVFDSLATHASTLEADDLFSGGQRLLGSGVLRAGARALALGLDQIPYRRDALYYLGTAYYTLGDSARLLPVAQRLAALDPLNRTSLRLLAAAWNLRGRKDSTLKYLAYADSVLAVEVAVSSFVPDSTGFTLTALATNAKSAPSKPFRLTFEFLDTRGQVAASQSAEVPAIPPASSHQIDLHVSGKAIVGWRYRAS